MARIDAFLKLGASQGCSDVHLAVGVPPMLRMNGDLLPIKFRELGEAELEGYVTEILSPSQQEQFRRGHDIDFSYVSGDGARFRVNLFRKDTGVGAVFRTIPTDVPTLDSLALPAIGTWPAIWASVRIAGVERWRERWMKRRSARALPAGAVTPAGALEPCIPQHAVPRSWAWLKIPPNWPARDR